MLGAAGAGTLGAHGAPERQGIHGNIGAVAAVACRAGRSGARSRERASARSPDAADTAPADEPDRRTGHALGAGPLGRLPGHGARSPVSAWTGTHVLGDGACLDRRRDLPTRRQPRLRRRPHLRPRARRPRHEVRIEDSNLIPVFKIPNPATRQRVQTAASRQPQPSWPPVRAMVQRGPDASLCEPSILISGNPLPVHSARSRGGSRRATSKT
jgi:hypothetical protein